ncbi:MULTISPECIES: efflux RND transporter periplasmic adaptor subunit [unclassified Herbaspirillum]|jgi:RND family efflux transporter MFP subunit|uniref:efflux RND transporter periplasmic adaptor subunit n=1 Tax=unclassified Herbaspirillum TaxID=2624150 RepID=UPI0015850615|nr:MULTISPECIES: efflux RND transporter periplasmic adaptor subunit [unclassified Herbaspirillum]MCI1004680.1 efflux RND transporter periplasmic adaptor subunit [Herbaspirillum sp. C7C8]NUT60499.1 efflux RND transporter periplasmic adaptor subunit [Herbaspirillum sp. C9C3]
MALLAVPFTLWLAGCSKPAPVAEVPREVVVLQAQERAGTQPLHLPAEVQSRYVTSLSFRVAGQLVERRVHLGDVVRKGQILARLDPADADQNAASARAELAAARQHLDAAEKQLQRDTAQAAEQLISAQQLEQSQDAHAAALSQWKAAQARAAVAGNQRDYTTLVAQHDGVISAEQANTGDVLSPGQPVYSLAWSGAVDVVTDVADRQLAGLQPGVAADVTLAALPGKTWKGRVREVSPAADPQSRTYRVKVTLEQPDASVRLGMTGEVTITPSNTTQTQVLLLPATALFHQGDKPAVWVVGADGKLVLRPVTVAAYGERSISLSQGVAASDKVVVQGVHTLTVGEKVKPVAPLHAEDFAL